MTTAREHALLLQVHSFSVGTVLLQVHSFSVGTVLVQCWYRTTHHSRQWRYFHKYTSHPWSQMQAPWNGKGKLCNKSIYTRLFLKTETTCTKGLTNQRALRADSWLCPNRTNVIDKKLVLSLTRLSFPLVRFRHKVRLCLNRTNGKDNRVRLRTSSQRISQRRFKT